MFNFFKRKPHGIKIKITKIESAIALYNYSHVYFSYWDYENKEYKSSILIKNKFIEKESSLISHIRKEVVGVGLIGKEFDI